MTELALRPYQERAIASLRGAYAKGARSVCFQLPTGGGKTVIFSHVVRGAVTRGHPVLILAHRQEIAEQIDEALTALDVPHGIIAAGRKPREGRVQVASVMTLAKRLAAYRPAPGLIVIDEAHHALAATWQRILGAFPQAKVLGVTATPQRLDGRGLGEVFDRLVCGPSTAELMRQDFLSPSVVYAPKQGPDLEGVRIVGGDYEKGELSRRMAASGLVGDAVEHYRKLADHKPAIAFCCSIEHSKAVAQRFRSAGYRAEHVDGDTPKELRRERIAALARGEIDVLTNCSLFGEGVDVPALGAVILLRPTASLALHLQMVGRALRPAPGKERAIILDHAGNSFCHGLPDDPHEWSLKSRKRRPGKKATIVRAKDGSLSHRLPKESAGKLAAMRRKELLKMHVRGMSYADVLAWANNPRKVRFVGRARGYEAGWAWHRINEIRGTA